MSSGIKDGIRKRADYRYNGLGQRVGQRVYENDNMNPEKEMQYTIDITRQYHNLLNLKDNITDKDQIYYWDMNVAVMEENEAYSYYLQDYLGSPMQLLDEEGLIMETYGFDEFGVELPTDNIMAVNANRTNNPTVTGLHNNNIQPFSFTGYQMDEAGEMYFAQARRYDAEAGRFVSEDRVAGFTDMPFTFNRYSYCWNRPADYVDLDGMFPWLVVGGLLIIGTVGGIVGGITNVITGQGDFDNGFIGGAINSIVTVVLSPVVGPFAANFAGGFFGSYVTGYLNNSEKPESEQVSNDELFVNAFFGGLLQSVIGGFISYIFSRATYNVPPVVDESWDIFNTQGMEYLTTLTWETMFSLGLTTSLSISSSLIWEGIKEWIENDEENELPDLPCDITR